VWAIRSVDLTPGASCARLGCSAAFDPQHYFIDSWDSKATLQIDSTDVAASWCGLHRNLAPMLCLCNGAIQT
jgi:hypothetical protein